ncbi:HAMP domain-containing sensor histidine kinase [Fulvivirga sp.]|uniref:sensor histidine kinase n=1 Tax=Fulvivirga sp. TaxID=1931237 RepID=UPI0032ED4267
MNSDSIERLLFTYMAQVLLAIILSFLFYSYYKNYNRSFLKWWSASWGSYAILYISSALLFVLPIEQRDFVSFLAIFSTYTQLLFIIIGLNEYILQLKTKPKTVVLSCLAVVAFSLITYTIGNGDAAATNLRYVLRVGIKSNIVGLGFLWLIYKILVSKAFHKSLSKTFMLLAFMLYSLQQLWHASIVYFNASGFSVPFPITSYGIIDLFSLSLIGISMVMWLLENEHNSLIRSNKELDSFLYSTSHDLRAPIASMLGLTNLGKIESKDSTAQNYFEKIERQLRKLDAIFGDILSYSKSAKSPVKISRLDFQHVVKNIYAQLKFSNSGTMPALIIDDSFTQYFYSDSYLIDSILSNLISNAIKYSDGKKENRFVKTSLHKTGKNTIIKVEDNGIGINEDSLPKIFEMFYRATGYNDGSGLGLYIATQAAARINATIEVESTENVGSTFTLILKEIKK